MNDSSFLKELGRSYIVSAFLPAAIFLLLAYFLFGGFVPASLVIQLSGNAIFRSFQWVILFFMTLWLAFYLFSANDFTVRLFEGYKLPKWLQKIMIERKQKKVEEILSDIEYLQKLKRKLNKQEEALGYYKETDNEKYAEKFLELRTELGKFGIQSPLSLSNVMPTRLGNVLRASETYAYERYRIEEISIWPRLFNVLPIEYVRTLEEKHNHFMFLINSSFLAFANAFISLCFALIGLLASFVPQYIIKYASSFVGFFYIGYDFVGPFGYLVISLVLGGFGYMMYDISVNSAKDLGLCICSSFDLYRVNLLRKMNWTPPKSIIDERILWEDFSRFIVSGTRLAEINFPEFQYEQKKQTNREPTYYQIGLEQNPVKRIKK